MKEYKKISVSLFRKHDENKPCGSINILVWLLQEPDCLQVINQIRSTTDKETIRQLKSKLPCITMSGTFSERNSGNLVQHSGLICIDIDGKDNLHITDMEDLKRTLSELPHVLYCGLSVGGRGVFCLIPIADPNKHREHFYSLEKDFQEMGIKVDSACKDVTRLRYRSYDPKPVININATVYEKLADTSSVTRMPRKVQNRTTTRVPNNADIQHVEESIMSIEDYFLKPMVDVNSNKPIQVMAKNAAQKVKEFVAYIVGHKVDITDLYDDWLDICIIITQTFREDGRELFHSISKFYPNYTPEECDRKYDDILTHQYKRKVDRLYEIAAKYGL
ncbi:BT4734/BF3469 family protein [Bacteroides fragilis]|uniref:BT4734/BF3469 family protein n=1 Tax=Bacteroides fragilis TaxID=817 RepID=UPI001C704A26|nr:BT4734/BF3469 family protein [Bacteroides fragilis]MBW9279506.1 hypothetical protein [Bacteroides fragilis]